MLRSLWLSLQLATNYFLVQALHCPTVANKPCKGAIGSAHLLLSTRAPHLSGTSGFARSPPSRRAFGPPQDEDSFLPNGWRAEKRNPMDRDLDETARAPLGAPHAHAYVR